MSIATLAFALDRTDAIAPDDHVSARSGFSAEPPFDAAEEPFGGGTVLNPTESDALPDLPAAYLDTDGSDGGYLLAVENNSDCRCNAPVGSRPIAPAGTRREAAPVPSGLSHAWPTLPYSDAAVSRHNACFELSTA